MPAITAREASKRKLALARVKDGTNEMMYILYDAESLLEYVKSDDWNPLSSKIGHEFIVGTVTVDRGEARRGRQLRVPSVGFAAARGGYGPLLYDIVMSMEGGLTSDRHSVKPAAKSVWKYYKDVRNDVVAKPFDDIDDPKTPPKVDDAELHPGGKKNPLNYAYFIKRAPNVAALIDNHDAVIKTLRKWGFTNDCFSIAADEFFLKYYKV